MVGEFVPYKPSGSCLVALIPARSGSKRLANKNVLPLVGHPLLAYSIAAAQESGIFQRIILSSDSSAYGKIAQSYGADYIYCSESDGHADDSPDINWVRHALDRIGYQFDAFAILRPTSPFRTAEHIRLAWKLFQAEQPADSLRAVRRVTEHPAKMWVIRNKRILPLLPFSGPSAPWHSMPTQSLPSIYVQTASLEIAWVKTVREYKSIAGVNIIPYVVSGPEAFDINGPADWDEAEGLARSGIPLPEPSRKEKQCP